MTRYANELLDYIESVNGGGRLAAEFYADDNFNADWRDLESSPNAETSEIVLEMDFDDE